MRKDTHDRTFRKMDKSIDFNKRKEIPLCRHHFNGEDRSGILDLLAHITGGANIQKMLKAQAFASLSSLLYRFFFCQYDASIGMNMLIEAVIIYLQGAVQYRLANHAQSKVITKAVQDLQDTGVDYVWLQDICTKVVDSQHDPIQLCAGLWTIVLSLCWRKSSSAELSLHANHSTLVV